jgi:hypothetical protein
MSIPEEILMAYVDGELDPDARTEFEAAMRNDPTIEKRVAQQRQLRARIELAYAGELAEPVPDRLLAAARGVVRKSEANIVRLDEARAAMAAASSRIEVRKSRWRLLTSMAASLLIGVGIGFFAWRQSNLIVVNDSRGTLVAGGSLARGLSSQLGGDRSTRSSMEIGLSFVAKSGDYCRTFTLLDASSAGLACRHSNRWEIRMLTESGPLGGGSEYRTAESGLPPAIRNAVEEQMSGEPLDRAAEIAARKQQWQAAGR